MPLYEYKCDKCGIVFDKLVSFRDKTEQHACPNCGSAETKRQFSSFAIGGGRQSSTSPSCASGSCPTGTCPYM